MEWKPIESFPKDGTDYLGLTEKGVYQIIRCNGNYEVLTTAKRIGNPDDL